MHDMCGPSRRCAPSPPPAHERRDPPMRQAPAGGPSGPRRAITDLYDEERRTFLVQYPVLLVIALGLTGVAAFAITGFLGRDGWARAITPTALDDTFRQPWVLYLWFCALMLTLLASIFRDKSLR